MSTLLHLIFRRVSSVGNQYRTHQFGPDPILILCSLAVTQDPSRTCLQQPETKTLSDMQQCITVYKLVTPCHSRGNRVHTHTAPIRGPKSLLIHDPRTCYSLLHSQSNQTTTTQTQITRNEPKHQTKISLFVMTLAHCPIHGPCFEKKRTNLIKLVFLGNHLQRLD